MPEDIPFNDNALGDQDRKMSGTDYPGQPEVKTLPREQQPPSSLSIEHRPSENAKPADLESRMD